jgi:hypothetical protein
MPAIPPTALKTREEKENIPAPQSDGIMLPTNEPMVIPPHMRVFELIEKVYHVKLSHDSPQRKH